MTIRLYAATSAATPGDAQALSFTETSRYRAAAHHARRLLPGALGELVRRELTAYADFGYRLSRDHLIDQLATQVLTAADGRAPQDIDPG